MNLNLNVPKTHSNLTPRLAVIGVGGAGGNAVNNMIHANLEGVEFLVANTDSQALSLSLCERCIQMGRNVTQGLGAGSRPDIGRAAAEEALDDILGELDGANMVFVTAGMGGGTGTGAAPVIARAAREAGILTVGVVTKPFHFEGVHRMRLAEAGITELTQYVDTLIVIPNQNLFRVANEKTTFADAFKMADDVLNSGVRGVTDLMVMPGLINLDFADIRSVMTEMGKAMMGTGEAEAEGRAVAAAEAAISNPLLDDVSMKGARGVLINITGGPDLTLYEVDEAANRIRDEVDPEANIIFGSTFDERMEGRMRVSVVATGIEVDEEHMPRPVSLNLVSLRSEATVPAAAAGEAEAALQAAPEAEAEPLQEAEWAEAAEAAVQADAAAEPAPEPETRPEPEPEPEPAEEAAPNALYAYSQRAVRAAAQARAAPAQAEREMAMAGEAPASGSRAGAAFIAPRPVQAGTSAHRAPAPAASAPGTRAPRGGEAEPEIGFDRRRAHSFLAKMTGGAARALHGVGAGGEQRVPNASAPGARAPAPAAQARPAAETPSAAPRVAVQPRLAGLDPAQRDEERQAEEDLLDIPAFLRRQAN